VSAINEAMTLNTDAIIEVYEGEVNFFKDVFLSFNFNNLILSIDKGNLYRN